MNPDHDKPLARRCCGIPGDRNGLGGPNAIRGHSHPVRTGRSRRYRADASASEEGFVPSVASARAGPQVKACGPAARKLASWLALPSAPPSIALQQVADRVGFGSFSCGMPVGRMSLPRHLAPLAKQIGPVFSAGRMSPPSTARITSSRRIVNVHAGSSQVRWRYPQSYAQLRWTKTVGFSALELVTRPRWTSDWACETRGPGNTGSHSEPCCLGAVSPSDHSQRACFTKAKAET